MKQHRNLRRSDRFYIWFTGGITWSLLGAALWSNEKDFIAVSVLMVLGSWFFPEMFEQVERAGSMAVDMYYDWKEDRK